MPARALSLALFGAALAAPGDAPGAMADVAHARVRRRVAERRGDRHALQDRARPGLRDLPAGRGHPGLGPHQAPLPPRRPGAGADPRQHAARGRLDDRRRACCSWSSRSSRSSTWATSRTRRRRATTAWSTRRATQFATIDQPKPPGDAKQLPDARRQRPAVPVALPATRTARSPTTTWSCPTTRPSCSTSPPRTSPTPGGSPSSAARRTRSRRPTIRQQDVVQDHREGRLALRAATPAHRSSRAPAPSCAATTTPTCARA